jgi:hypothetical protein
VQSNIPIAAEIEQAQAGLRESIESAKRLSEQSQQLVDRSRPAEAGGGAEA